ncbi:hypothetical protein OE88DRAFT_1658875 [Heliocybe sulcata]|uniref:DNA glycosylase n=1 Tax=Heliocybe sulcata TaxID=5364 RepID=A0A5C3N372_9AGAM|nr:hypothetical protein OE88DRAFT_1658875 [Heliocybe sulcata]
MLPGILMSLPETPKKCSTVSPYFSPSVESRYFNLGAPHVEHYSGGSVVTAPAARRRTVWTVLAEHDSSGCDSGIGGPNAVVSTFQFERSLTYDPAFLSFGDLFIQTYDELWHSKPILIQEHVNQDPWKLLVATMFLNKTAGRISIPIFWEVMKRWATPQELSLADATELIELIKPLGLQHQRAKRLIQLSSVYMSNPPSPDLLYRSKSPRKRVRPTGIPGVSTGCDALEDTAQPVTYPPTPISHLPGAGPYALDSYRIFCVPGDEWKIVRPTDKELIKYLKWRWAITSFDFWDPDRGIVRKIELAEMQSLTAELRASRGSHGLDEL